MAKEEIKEEGRLSKDFPVSKEPFRERKKKTGKALLYLLLLALVLGFAFFRMFKGGQEEPINIGSLSIRSNPSQATVYLDGEEKGLTPCKIIELPSGGYIVEVAKDGFTKERRGITIAPNQPQLALSIDLKEAAQEKEEVVAKLPKEEKEPPVPVKEEEVEKKENAVAKKKELSKEVAASKNIGTGTLFVTSNPAGATLYIDHQEKGITPLKVEKVAIGKRRVGLIKEGCSTWIDYFEVEKNEQTSVRADLESIYGKMSVSSNPAGATLYLNGEEKGKTPLALDRIVPLKAQKITLLLEDYQDWEMETFVDPKGETKVEANLSPGKSLRSPLYVTSSPSLVKVYLDQDFIGLTPIRGVPILPGEHLVEAEKEGFVKTSKEITALGKRSSFVNFTLDEEK